MKRIKVVPLFLALFLLIGSLPVLRASAEAVSSLEDMDALFLSKSIPTESGDMMKYRLYIPEDYDPQRAYPVVLFLHGAGERGSDNVKQLKAGIIEPFKQANSPIYECIVIAPQCPEGKKWVNTSEWSPVYSTEEIPESEELQTVLKIVAAVQEDYSTDSNRLYVTGLSMGGFGTWDLLVRHPDLFAAAIPVCGGCDPSKAERLLSIPIRTFHGLLDEKVLPVGTQQMAQAMQTLDAENFVFTPLPDMDHYIWSTVYAQEDLFYWLLSQTRKSQANDPVESESESESESETEPESESKPESTSDTETESLPQEPSKSDSDTPKAVFLAVGIVVAIGVSAAIGFAIFRRKRK